MSDGPESAREGTDEGDAYAKAGVDRSKVKHIQSDMASVLERTFALRADRLGKPLIPVGHYAGVIDIGGDMALAMHTDGVGTKVLVAQQLGRFDTIGIDCIAMTVNDLICVGSEPAAILDYIALEREDDGLVSEITKGLVEGASRAKVAIVGGETAIMGEIIHGFDLVSMGVGFVRKSMILDGKEAEAGDRVVGVASSGLHSNGFSLARKILLPRYKLTEEIPELGGTLGEALLKPTSIYVEPALELIRERAAHAISHITGGAFSKLSRLLSGRHLEIQIANPPPPPPIFRLLENEGGLSRKEMYSTFNMGIGLAVFCEAARVDYVIRTFGRYGFAASEIGRLVSGGSGVSVGDTRVSAD